MVAGKWRQIAFGQLPHGPETGVLQNYTIETAKNLMEIASCAGWGGDTQEIQRRVWKLMVTAESIRMDVKAGNISADFQPWVASYGEKYEESMMKDVGGAFGLEQVQNVSRCHVLGSTEVGLKVRRTGVGASSEKLKELRSRPRVVLIESLLERHHSTKR